MTPVSRGLLATVLAALIVAHAGQRASMAAGPAIYRDSVTTFYDNILKYGRDDYGQRTPLFESLMPHTAKRPLGSRMQRHQERTYRDIATVWSNARG